MPPPPPPPPPGYNSNTNGVRTGTTIPQATPKTAAFPDPAPGTPTLNGSYSSQGLGRMKPRTKK
jgi:hypothetical protein